MYRAKLSLQMRMDRLQDGNNVFITENTERYCGIDMTSALNDVVANTVSDILHV